MFNSLRCVELFLSDLLKFKEISTPCSKSLDKLLHMIHMIKLSKIKSEKQKLSWYINYGTMQRVDPMVTGG